MSDSDLRTYMMSLLPVIKLPAAKPQSNSLFGFGAPKQTTQASIRMLLGTEILDINLSQTGVPMVTKKNKTLKSHIKERAADELIKIDKLCKEKNLEFAEVVEQCLVKDKTIEQKESRKLIERLAIDSNITELVNDAVDKLTNSTDLMETLSDSEGHNSTVFARRAFSDYKMPAARQMSELLLSDAKDTLPDGRNRFAQSAVKPSY